MSDEVESPEGGDLASGAGAAHRFQQHEREPADPPARRVFMVRYTCKPERAEENAALVRGLIDALHAHPTVGVGYAGFELEDGMGFVHLVVTETDAGLAPLADLDAYRKLQEGKMDRFEERPVVTELRELGSFRIFTE